MEGLKKNVKGSDRIFKTPYTVETKISYPSLHLPSYYLKNDFFYPLHRVPALEAQVADGVAEDGGQAPEAPHGAGHVRQGLVGGPGQGLELQGLQVQPVAGPEKDA